MVFKELIKLELRKWGSRWIWLAFVAGITTKSVLEAVFGASWVTFAVYFVLVMWLLHLADGAFEDDEAERLRAKG